MLTISPISQITSTYKNHNINNKVFVNNNDEFTPSFKGSYETEKSFFQQLCDEILTLKVKGESRNIIKKSEDIKEYAQLEYTRVSSIVNSRINQIEKIMQNEPHRIIDVNGTKYIQGKRRGEVLKDVIFKLQDGQVNIKRVDVTNEDGSKDCIWVDDNNRPKFIRKGVKHISPNSYISEKTLKYENGRLTYCYKKGKKVNDGVAISCVDSRHHVYKYANGYLTSYSPKTTSVGNEPYYDKLYLFDYNALVRYMEDVPVIDGELSPARDLIFDEQLF